MADIPTSVHITLDSPSGGAPFKIIDPEGKATDADLEKAKAAIEREMVGLSEPEKRRVAARLLRQYEAEMRRVTAERDSVKRHLEALESLQAWVESKPPGRLEKNDCSRLHLLKQAAREGKLEGKDEDGIKILDAPESFHGLLRHTFVVKHDWGRVFERVEGIEDQIKLPYELCCFEFRMDGRSIIAVATDCEEADGLKFTAFVQADLWWAAVGGSKPNPEAPVIQAMWKQIRAICIALDSEVATSTVVRAPHKLNEKREREGKLPLEEYRIVDLSRRHRVANPTQGHSGRHVRLHFRRGHWRHFETTKTWVRWCLVGDPDLGFISKEYTL